MDNYLLIQEIAKSLVVFDVNAVSEICGERGVWARGQSAKVNCKKHLDALAERGIIERLDGFYRVKGCRSEYKDHARKLTQCLAEFWNLPCRPVIKREFHFTNGLVSDGIILLIQSDKGLCIILEVANTETDEYFQAKVNELKRNKGKILTELTQLFGYQIPDFVLAVEGKKVEGVYDFRQLIQKLKGGL